ncbi:MAG: RICIN domain-containing protein [Oscillospiraceae bacterium]|nr:RICIN domain-containing protein [Oscillospiraceae bacterium]
MSIARKRISAIIATVCVAVTAVSANLSVSSMAASNYISDGWYYIKNINSQKYLDVSGKKDANGSNVIQYQGNGGANQKWYVKNLGNNVITIQSGLSSGRMLDVENGYNTDGANIRLWEANGATAQQFKVVKSSSNVYCLLTENSGETKAIDVYDWSSDNNGNINQWTYNGLACQQFKFESTSAGSSSVSSSSGSSSSSSSGSSNSSSTSSGNTIEVKNGGTSLSDAIKKASSGTTIVINGTVKSGAIKVPAGVNISGKNNATIDFSSTSGSNGRGLSFYGNGSTIENVTIKNASDNGIYIEGSKNTFKYVTCCYNQDAGFQVSNGGSDNKFYNCYSHHNADAKGENADGFANKLHSGTGNYYENCVAEYNSDDGWDCYAAHGAVTLVNCQANYNGYCDGIYGDGNGFKMGGVDNKTSGVAAHLDPCNHVLKGCTAKGNYASGFDRNNQNGVVTMENCIADGNKKNNYNWPLTGKPSALGYEVTFGKAKIISCTSKNGSNNIKGATLSGNCQGF